MRIERGVLGGRGQKDQVKSNAEQRTVVKATFTRMRYTRGGKVGRKDEAGMEAMLEGVSSGLLLRCLPLAVSAVHSHAPAHCTAVAAAASSAPPPPPPLHRRVVPVSEFDPLSISSAAAARERKSVAAAAAVAAEADGEGRRGNTVLARRVALGEGAKERKSSDSRDGTGAVSEAAAACGEGRENSGTLFDANSRNGGQHDNCDVGMHEDAWTPAAGLVHGAVSGMAKVPSAEENRSRKRSDSQIKRNTLSLNVK